jgi:hypothetical protein
MSIEARDIFLDDASLLGNVFNDRLQYARVLGIADAVYRR